MVKLFGYHIKGLQQMEGHDGYVRRGIIMKGKKPIVEFFDDGNGGMVDYRNFVSADEVIEMQNDIARHYASYGVDAGRHNDFVPPSDFLIDDLAMLTDIEKNAKKESRKHKGQESFVIIGTKKYFSDNLVLGAWIANFVPKSAKEIPDAVEYIGAYKVGKITVEGKAA